MNNMSPMAEDLKRLFNNGEVTIKGMNNAAEMGWITYEEYNEITGKEYDGSGTAMIAVAQLDAAYKKGVQLA